MNARVLFLSHGGGPLPLLGDPGHARMVTCLESIASMLPRPDAIVVVSAHWEAPVATVTTGATPSLIYDYYGFPESAYRITYPCTGNPPLAQTLLDLLKAGNVPEQGDEERGFDHGLFVPLKILYPQADIPCVQLSLRGDLDAEAHVRMGEALAPLLEQNVLVIGSGFSFHNMRAFFGERTAEAERLNQQFEDWLDETCTGALSAFERRQRLVQWSQAPGARFCHPREEHLLPLHVCCGMTGRAASESFRLDILERHASMYLW